MLKQRKYRRLLNRFSITITDVNGSRHFYLSAIIKKVAFYTVLCLLIFIVSSTLYISYLASKVSELDGKRQRLSIMNAEIEKNMSVQAERYAGIEEQIATFEQQLGLFSKDDEDNNLTPMARIEHLNLTNAQQKEVLLQIPNGWPIVNTGISGKYGWRDHPILKKQEFHPGIDLMATLDTPVYATANGVVEFSGYNSNGYGYMVILIHNFGFKTVYAHLKNKIVVRSGTFVKKGDLIGYSGNTGLSTGPHLHYEVRFVNNTLNPSYFLNLNRQNMDNFFNQERRVPWESLIKLIPTRANQKPQ